MSFTFLFLHLLITAALELGSARAIHSSGQARSQLTKQAESTCSPSVVHLYIDNSELFEWEWIFRVVLSGVAAQCTARLQIRPRAQFTGHHNCSSSAAVLVARMGLTREELTYMRSQSLAVTSRIMLLHLSDEKGDSDVSGYDKFAFVYRNYLRSDVDADFTYLLPGAQGGGHHDRHIFWLPLGYGYNFIHNPSLVVPTSARPLLFSWSGSLNGGKPERKDMLDALRAAPEAMDKGFIETFEEFGAAPLNTPGAYAPTILNAKLIPCPAGTVVPLSI